jgi:peptide/nickel transport system substrate-binding protein
MAIDRKKIVKVAMFNYTEPAHPTALNDAFASIRIDRSEAMGRWLDFDPESAARTLDSQGYPRGVDGWRRTKAGSAWDLEIIVVNGWSDWVRAGQIIAKDLQAIGVKAHIKTYDWGAWFDRLSRGEFTGAVAWAPETVDPYYFYRFMMSQDTKRPIGEVSAMNWQRFGDARADSALKAFESAFEPSEQRTIIQGVQRIFLEDAPALPLFANPAWGTANTTHFTGFPSQDNPYATLSPNLRPDILLVLTALRPAGAAIDLTRNGFEGERSKN